MREGEYVLDEKSIAASKIEDLWAMGYSILHSAPTRYLVPTNEVTTRILAPVPASEQCGRRRVIDQLIPETKPIV